MELIGDLAKSYFILSWEERMEGEATGVTVNVDERSITGWRSTGLRECF